MSGNTSLSGLAIEDFSRLTSIKGIETAPALKEFRIGNAIWSKMIIESLMPLANTKIERLSFTGRAIGDNDLSFLETLPDIKAFDFSTNMFSTEQVAWIVANCPHAEGYALKAKVDCMLLDSNEHMVDVPKAIIVGKRKPILKAGGSEERIFAKGEYPGVRLLTLHHFYAILKPERRKYAHQQISSSTMKLI